ncbi:MAG: D-cysteine desulfhydrase family protein [Chloroflexi bacterium]|nr:D-cysteine desulfhydrase family protein [Chloroflexota bacterium]MCI0576675.1 D-cysteine desulfhydrase family protein [Chloroflexota bacterium]MCI0647988.1 D-cysteine desulfhydrase family protein [Chloroflexota bacterium]MCI0726802.1 D-cysteine desulfhydrase family protein [Chloroflexota bacterium]
MLFEQLRAQLARFPKLDYSPLPTPLAPLARLTGQLGGPRLWVKRDDGLGPGMGGNKGRKLAFLMAEIQRQGKRKVITYGGLQSNHARMTAAACAALELEAHLFFFERRPPTLPGNLLLDRLFGARLHFIPFGGGGGASMTLEAANRLVRLVALPFTGPGAYFMPVGGHNVTGCLGYVAAALELHEQVAQLGLEPVTVVTAAGTGGTLAGLLAGFTLLDSPVRLLGIDVGKLWKAFPVSIGRLAGELCAALGEPHDFRPEDVPIIERTYAGPAYAVLTAEAGQAIQTLAQSEGIVLDPVYTGKAFAGLLDLIRQGRFRPGEHVIFLHTGGAPGLWAYEEPLSAFYRE